MNNMSQYHTVQKPPTYNGLGSNLGPRGETPTCGCLSHGMGNVLGEEERYFLMSKVFILCEKQEEKRRAF